ncbi:phospho-sugar mutase [Demequina sp.]|uniref:phospho-sugar mutase n=1 Tax=Demequina sp. TaxID=2050685 RepID=UPI0025BA3021|nr:phospho-sugar mutase [Demequina sp.]
MDVSDIDDAAVAAGTWLADDPDPATRAELKSVLEAVAAGDTDAAVDLADRMSGLLQFGTAGLRGRLGAGPNRMNRAVVIRAAAGLSSYVTAQLGHRGTIVVGYDARHGSTEFAHDTVAVAVAAGHRALLLPSPLPTPVLAYAVKALGADAGVMVTASHNPAWDNGYKVYLGASITPEAAGAQIVPPHDAGIATLIEAVGAVAGIQRATSGWEVLSPSVVDDYAAKVAALVPTPQGDVATRRAGLKVVLTPIHGVGDATVRQALTAAGLTDLTSVPEQAEPDPDFPTVAFPNPEEPGAIDLALKLATTIGADVVIANDPDTDRCAVATVIDGDWRMLHGDVVGSLLGERIAAAHAGQPEATLANSIVSSRQLAAIAKRHGLAHANTLTGFKWISRAPHLLYGYEEALGYCAAPALVLDKDGVSTAVLIAELVSELKAQGRTLADAIDNLALHYGVYLSSQVSARFDDLSQIPELMTRLLASPPATLAGSVVTATDDMNDGFAGLPPTNGLHLGAESGARVIIRPSGTEPKVKAYLEVIEEVEAGDVRGARGRADSAMAALRADVEKLLGV